MPDYRTKPESELTFYTISQPEGIFNIARYDTLEEAINKFNEVKDLTSFAGIGISKYGRSELDIIHKKDDLYVLVTDYTRSDTFKCDREVREAVKNAIGKLGIVWEYNSTIFNSSVFSSLCVPCVVGNENILHNESVDNLSLDPEILNKTASSIERMYISDKEEWLPLLEVMSLCRDGEHPKIESIEVKVEDIHTKEKGTITVSPQDYILMADNYLLSHVKGFPLYETELAFDKLAGDLNDFMFDFDSYEYNDNLPAGGELEAIEDIAKDLKNGNVQPIIDQLSSIIEEGEIEANQLFQANELISRLKKIEPEHTAKRDLEDKIKNAEVYSSINTNNKTRNENEPDKNR